MAAAQPSPDPQTESAANSHGHIAGDLPGADILAGPATELWKTYQAATATLGEVAAKLGFLDVAVCGFQSSGKSTLLEAISGLKLPVGPKTVTKCPIRITVDERNIGVKLEMPSGGSMELGSEGLAVQLYQKALQDMSEGKVTAEELRISAQGRPGHPPLNLLDLPGFIPNPEADNAVAIDEMVRHVLQGGSAGHAVLPIMTITPTLDFNALRLELVSGRPFLAVLTHLSHLLTDKKKFKELMEMRSNLEDKGCVGFFMFALDGDSTKEANNAWYEEFCTEHSSSPSDKADILSCCGVARLLARVQDLQLQHILEERNEIMARVAKKMEAMKPQLLIGKLTDNQLRAKVRTIVRMIEQDIQRAHHEGKTTLDAAHTDIPQKYRLADEAKKITEKFAADSALTVLASITQGWAHAVPDSLADKTLLSDWKTVAWNYTVPGLFKIVSPAYFGTAIIRMLDTLKNFAIWRAEERFAEAGLGSALKHFISFWPQYASSKSTALAQETACVVEELNNNKLAMVAAWVYIAIEAKAVSFKDIVKYFPTLSTDLTKKAELLRLSAIELQDFSRSDFEKEANSVQTRTRLLGLIMAMQLTEGLSRRLTNIIFGRTYTANIEFDCPLDGMNLSQAFESFLENYTSKGVNDNDNDNDKGFNFKDLISDSQQQLQESFKALQSLHTALSDFSKHARPMPKPASGVQEATDKEVEPPKTPEAAEQAPDAHMPDSPPPAADASASGDEPSAE